VSGTDKEPEPEAIHRGGSSSQAAPTLAPGTYDVVVLDANEHDVPPSIDVAVSTGEYKGYVCSVPVPGEDPARLLGMLGEIGTLTVTDSSTVVTVE
jgi:hypothetical protein